MAVRQVVPHLLLRDLGVVHQAGGAVLHEAAAHVNGGRLPGVSGVLLEREAQDGDVLVADGVEHAGDDAPHEAVLLVVVDGNHALPVLGHLLEALGLADVHQVQDVLLEAGAAEADGGVQEAGAHPGVLADGVRHLGHVRASRLAQGADAVDAADALRQEGVGRQLGQLRRPQVGGDHPLRGHPVLVHSLQRRDGRPPRLGVLPAADEHPVGGLQVLNGGALGQELGVGQDLELDARVHAVPLQHLLDGLRRADGHGGLLHHNLVGGGHSCNRAGSRLPVRQVRSLAGADAVRLGGRVHAGTVERGTRLSGVEGRGEKRGDMCNCLQLSGRQSRAHDTGQTRA